MSDNKQHFHGSDLERVAAHYGLEQESIINYSGNVNPLGLSKNIQSELAKHIDLIAKYPDRDYTSLRKAIADYIQVAWEHIIVGNGSTELISLFIKALSPKNALIVGPTYSEYEREIFIQGGKSRYFPLAEEDDFAIHLPHLKEALTVSVDLLVLCNPNNPTSSAIDRKTLRAILDHCLEQDIDVMIDETYVEFAEDTAATSAVSLARFYPNLFIIRGVSKFFAAPGLRLGYGISGSPSRRHQINNMKNPWTINSLAAYAGELMVQDKAYIEATRTLIHTERRRMTDIMAHWPEVKVFPAHGNFLLIKLLNEAHNSHQIFDTLIRQGLMVRDASSFPFLSNKYLRFCILMPEDNDRLLAALRKALD